MDENHGTGAQEMDSYPRVQAVVVGSGFGGSVTACRLAQAGFDVLVLERGRRFEKGDFPPLPQQSELVPDTRRWLWGSELGLWEVLDLEEVTSVQAAGYGGGSLIYANVHLRPPEAVFGAPWPPVFRERAELDPYFDLAGYMMQAAPTDAPGRWVKAERLHKAADSDQRVFFSPPLAIQFEAGTNVHGVPQGACTSCGSCSTGCPERAKNTLDLNYLALAENNGAKARTQCEVIDVERTASGRWLVRFIDHLAAAPDAVEAENVFLCAGSVHSTRLLAKAEASLARDDRDSLVGIAYFPGGDALGVVFDTKEPSKPSVGPTISGCMVHWQDPERGGFFLVQDGGYPEQLTRLIGMLAAPVLLGRNRLTRATQRSPRSSPSTQPRAVELPSMFDQLLQAASGELAQQVISGELRKQLRAFVEELQQPLLLPDVVDRTIDLMIDARLSRAWPWRWLPKEGLLRKLCFIVERWVIRWIYGGGPKIAPYAGEALLTAAGLSPERYAARVFGYDDRAAQHRLMLLGMGRDAAPGVLSVSRETGRIVADLDLYHLVPSYTQQEQLMADIARRLGGELRVNPAWSFLGKPVTVHNQGGCPMHEDADLGVTDPNGKVHGCDGLYVMDAAAFCSSVGVNPSATILALAERNVLKFIQSQKPRWPDGYADSGAVQYSNQRRAAVDWKRNAVESGWHLEPPRGNSPAPRSKPVGVRLEEEMRGYCAPLGATSQRPTADDDFLELERVARPEFPLCVQLELQTPNLAAFIEDQWHRMQLTGHAELRLPGEAEPVRREVEGRFELFVKRRKPYAMTSAQVKRRDAQDFYTQNYVTPDIDGTRSSGAKYEAARHSDLTPIADVAAAEQFMHYHMNLVDKPGWSLRGYKRISDKPGLEGWRDVSCLFVRLVGPDPRTNEPAVHGAGAIRVDLTEFLSKQVPSIRATGDVDDVHKLWAVARFAGFFFGKLQRIYFPQLRSVLDTLFRTNSFKRLDAELQFEDILVPDEADLREQRGRR